MSLTLANIQTQTRLLTKEPNPSNPTFATDANVLSWANQAQLEIQSRVKDRWASNLPNSTDDPTDTTSAGVRLYSFPSTIMDLTMVTVNGIKLTFCKYEDLYTMGGLTWNKYKSMPQYYYLMVDPTSGDQKIGMWPCPSSAWKIIYIGIKKPTAMTTSTTSPDLDERLHYAVLYRVCQTMSEMRRETDKAQYWEQMFEKELQKYYASARLTTEGNRFLNDASPSD